jgi:hypothetical protein
LFYRARRIDATMKPFQVIFAQPWPLFGDRACSKIIVRAQSLMRALEVAQRYGAIANIGESTEIPVIDDNREGAINVVASQTT